MQVRYEILSYYRISTLFFSVMAKRVSPIKIKQTVNLQSLAPRFLLVPQLYLATA